MLTLVGCTAGDETAVPDASTESTLTCEHPDGYALAYPADWHTYSGEELGDVQLACRLFGTAPVEIDWTYNHLPSVPISIRVDPFWGEDYTFEDITRPEFDPDALIRELEGQDATAAGRPAVRMRAVSELPEGDMPNQYQVPSGTELVIWYVDLSTATEKKVLRAVVTPPAVVDTGVSEADKSAERARSVDSTVEVLETMLDTLTLTD